MATDNNADDSFEDELEEQAEQDRKKNEMLQRKIDDAEVEGWSLHQEQGDRAVMIKRKWGSIWIHAVLLIFTFGVGNVIYWAYKYIVDADKKVVRV